MYTPMYCTAISGSNPRPCDTLLPMKSTKAHTIACESFYPCCAFTNCSFTALPRSHASAASVCVSGDRLTCVLSQSLWFLQFNCSSSIGSWLHSTIRVTGLVLQRAQYQAVTGDCSSNHLDVDSTLLLEVKRPRLVDLELSSLIVRRMEGAPVPDPKAIAYAFRML